MGDEKMFKQQEQTVIETVQEQHEEVETGSLQSTMHTQDQVSVQSENLFAEEMQGKKSVETEPVEKTEENASEQVLSTVLSSEGYTKMSTEAEKSVDVLVKVQKSVELSAEEKQRLERIKGNLSRSQELYKQGYQKKEEKIESSTDISFKLISPMKQEMFGSIIDKCRRLIDDNDESSALFTSVKDSIKQFLTALLNSEVDKESTYMPQFVKMRSCVLSYYTTNKGFKWSKKGRRRRDATKELLKDMGSMLIGEEQEQNESSEKREELRDRIRMSFAAYQEKEPESLNNPETKKLYKQLAQADAIRQGGVNEEALETLTEWSFRLKAMSYNTTKRQNDFIRYIKEKYGTSINEMVKKLEKSGINCTGTGRQINHFFPCVEYDTDGSITEESDVEGFDEVYRKLVLGNSQQQKEVIDGYAERLLKIDTCNEVIKDAETTWANLKKIDELTSSNVYYDFLSFNRNLYPENTFERFKERCDSYSDRGILLASLKTQAQINSSAMYMDEVSYEDQPVIKKQCSIDGIVPDNIIKFYKGGRTQSLSNLTDSRSEECRSLGQGVEYLRVLYGFVAESNKYRESDLKDKELQKLSMNNYVKTRHELQRKDEKSYNKFRNDAGDGVNEEDLRTVFEVKRKAERRREIKTAFLKNNGYYDRLFASQYINKVTGNMDRCVIGVMKDVKYDDFGFPLTEQDKAAQEWNVKFIEAILTDKKEALYPFVKDLYEEMAAYTIPQELTDSDLYQKILESSNFDEVREDAEKLYRHRINYTEEQERIRDLNLLLFDNVCRNPMVKEYFENTLKKDPRFEQTEKKDAVIRSADQVLKFIIPIYGSGLQIDMSGRMDQEPAISAVKAMTASHIVSLQESLETEKKQ